MADPGLLELRRGPFTLRLAPRLGGAIAGFRWRGREVMRPAGVALLEAGEMRMASSFPLVPFSGRIANGRVGLRGAR